MKKQAHTPGPWTVKQGQQSIDVKEWHITATRPATEACRENPLICICEEMGGDGAGRIEGQANAALIASAPDLLAERDRLNAINTKMLWTLDHCAEIAKCQAMRIEDVRLAMGEIYRIAREAMEAAQAYNRERIAKEATR